MNVTFFEKVYAYTLPDSQLNELNTSFSSHLTFDRFEFAFEVQFKNSIEPACIWQQFNEW